MTRLETLEIQEQRLRSIVELAPACLARVTRDGSILAMNGAARSLFAATEARDVLKRSLVGFATSADHTQLQTLIEHGCDGKAASLELTMTRLSGELREIEVSIVGLPARGETPPTALLTFRDVSSQRRLEDSVIAKARAEAEQDARAAADRAHEAELARIRGEVDDAAQVATAMREAATRDAARLEELERELADLAARYQQLVADRTAQDAGVEAAKAETRAAGHDREELCRLLDEARTRADADRRELVRQLDETRVRAESERAALTRELEERGLEIARLQEAHAASERAAAEQLEAARTLEMQRQDGDDRAQLAAEHEELKRSFERARAAHATEMAMAFADRAALERRVQDTEARQRRFDAEIARLTAERDGVSSALAESQQHEQRARRLIAHWIELEQAMQLARTDLHRLAEWAHGTNGHSLADDTPIERAEQTSAAPPTVGEAPWH